MVFSASTFPLILLFGLTLGCEPAQAIQEASAWSRFRGPAGLGHGQARDLPAEFSAEQNCSFQVSVPAGHSSPVLSRDSIFLTGERDQELWTLALSREDGHLLWEQKAPRTQVTKVDQRNHAASPTPALNDQVVVVFFPDYGLLCYDHQGVEQWRVPLGPFRNVYGMGASPILHEQQVLLACDQNKGSFLASFSLKDGSENWRTLRPYARSGHCTPLLWVNQAGRTEVILPGSFYLDAYDVDSGLRQWWVKGLSFEMKSVPAIQDGVLYINGFGSPMNNPGNQVQVPDFPATLASADGNQDGKIGRAEMPAGRAANWFDFVDLDVDGHLDAEEWQYLSDALGSLNGLLAIRLGGEGDCTESNLSWAYRRSIPQMPSPLAIGDHLFVLSDSGGLLTTFSPTTGELIRRDRIPGAIGNFYAAPVVADGKIFLASLEGLVVVLPDDGSFTPLAVNDLGEPIYATPAPDGQEIYVRTGFHLFCFSVKG